MLGVDVVRPLVVETTSLGAAYLAGLATGYWDSVETIRQLWQQERVFQPSMPAEQVARYINGWNRAVKAAIAWTQ